MQESSHHSNPYFFRFSKGCRVIINRLYALKEPAPGDAPERAVAERLTRLATGAGIFGAIESAENFCDELSALLYHRVIALEEGVGQEGFTPSERIAPLPDEGDANGMTAVSVSRRQNKNALRRLELLSGHAVLAGKRLSAVLPVENPDAAAFISYRKNEETAAVARALGQRALQAAMHHVMDACDRDSLAGFDPAFNLSLRQALKEAKEYGAMDAALYRAISYARQGHEEIKIADEEESMGGFSAVLSVPGDFVETALTNHAFDADGRHVAADQMWDDIADAVWASGEPSIFFRDAVLPEAVPGPLGGLVFSPGVEAPSAAIDLLKFSAAGKTDVAALAHVVKVLVITLEASFFGAKVSPKTLECRPLVIGIAHLPDLIAAAGLSYDSGEARALASVTAAAVTGAAHLASAEIAQQIGACTGYQALSRYFFSHFKNRIAALPGAGVAGEARALWEEALALSRHHGLRHLHVTGMGYDRGLQEVLQARTLGLAPLDETALPAAQARMQAAVEPFLSGAINHTILLGHHATIGDVQKLLLLGWELGVKHLRLYRHACSLLQPVVPLMAADEEPVRRKRRIGEKNV